MCKRLADLIPISPNLYLCDYCAGLPFGVHVVVDLTEEQMEVDDDNTEHERLFETLEAAQAYYDSLMERRFQNSDWEAISFYRTASHRLIDAWYRDAEIVATYDVRELVAGKSTPS